MRLIHAANLLVAALITILGYELFSSEGGPVSIEFPVISWGGMLLLALYAGRLRRQGSITLDSAGATVQTVGICSLLVGLGIAINTLVKDKVHVVDGSFNEFQPLVVCVVEALVSVAIGTYISNMLSTIEEVKYGTGGNAGDPNNPWTAGMGIGSGGTGTGINFSGVQAEVRRLAEQMAAVNGEAEKMRTAFQGLTQLSEQVGRLLTAMKDFFPDTTGGR